MDNELNLGLTENLSEAGLAKKIAKAADVTASNREQWRRIGGDEILDEERKRRFVSLQAAAGQDKQAAEKLTALDRLGKFQSGLGRLSGRLTGMRSSLVSQEAGYPLEQKIGYIERSARIIHQRLLQIGEVAAKVPSFASLAHSVISLLSYAQNLSMYSDRLVNQPEKVAILETAPTRITAAGLWITRLRDEMLGVGIDRLYSSWEVAKTIKAGHSAIHFIEDESVFPWLIGDPQLLPLLAGELENNSLKARPRDLRTEIRLDFDPDAESLIFVYQDNAGGLVGDNLRAVAGQGQKLGLISAEELQQVESDDPLNPELEAKVINLIFTPGISGFSQTGRTGTGFGLADFRQRIHEQGGEIRATNLRQGEKVIGLRFDACFPARYRK
ncbi:MAG TPA: hypothetical protein VMW41_02745 [Candidatus Bathyarchaeia archaeon]|nr:hypothetical protein [Candidatus Bathyarchaeia archaeon]